MTQHAPLTAREDRDTARSVLPGGLRVVSQRRRGNHGAHLGWFVGVGSRDEKPRQQGCSHVLEHVLFKGTKTRSAVELTAAIEGVGGDLNAWTARDHTAFHARLLRDDLPLALDVIGDMVTASVIRPIDLASEKEVILDEIAMHRDDPAELAAELAHGALFEGDPLARPVIGTEESISALSRDQVKNYWRRHYHSSNFVISAVGDFDHDDLVAMAADLSLPQTGTRRPVSSLAPRPAGEPLSHFTRLSQTSVTLAFPGCARDDPRRFALSVLTTALGGGMSSRLFQRVREQCGLAYSIDSSDQSWEGAGSATIDWQALPGRTATILAHVRAEVDRVRQDGISAAELTAAVNLIRGQTLLSMDSGSSTMSWLGAAWLHGDDRSLDEVIEAYQRVTLEDVTAVARQVFGVRPVVALAGGRCRMAGVERELSRW